MKNFSRYQLIEEIGSGGSGIVHKAFDPVLNKTFALKVLKKTSTDNHGWIRFQKEAKTLCDLQHPSIPEIYNFDINEDDEPYMVMELIAGISLKDYLRDKKVLSLDETIDITSQICDSLAYAHSQKVLHRDIKPANAILVDTEETDTPKVMLIDFGLAKLDERNKQDMTKTGLIIGTPPYMSPEQIKGEEMDERSDLYSLGCLVFELLTGEKPFVGVTPMKTLALHLSESPPELVDKNPEGIYSDELESIISKALSKQKEDRFQTVAELKNALVRLQESDLLISAVNEIFEEPEQEKKNNNNFLKLALVTVFIIVLVVTALVFQLSKHSQVEESLTATATVKIDPLIDTRMPKAKSSGARGLISTVKENQQKEKKELEAKKKKSTIFDKNNCKLIRLQGFNVLELRATPEFTDDNFKNLIDSKKLPQNLNRWNFSGSKITDASLLLLPSRKIAKLDIGKTDITNKNLKYLKGLNPRFLSISDTKISDQGMKWISQIKSLKKLRIINCENVTNNGIECLSNLTGLVELIISGEKVNNQTIILISKIKSLHSITLPYMKLKRGSLVPLLNLPKLRTLGLNHCVLSKSAIRDLEHFKKLKRLALINTNLGIEEVRRLQKALGPRVVVYRYMVNTHEYQLKRTEMKLRDQDSPEYLLYFSNPDKEINSGPKSNKAVR